MVYCGPPSKGCETCRQRKIRCDQRPEGCGNCEHMKRTCPGYRNQLDLIFRNESREVKRKANSKARSKTHSTKSSTLIKSRKEGSTKTRDSNATQSTGGIDQLLLCHPIPLDHVVKIYPSNEERAIAYFFSNYVTARSTISLGSYQPEGSLLHCMQAVGLMGIMSSANAPSLRARVDKEYVEAIKLTNNALSSPTEATKDSTLLGIIILSIFEAVSGRGAKSLLAWENHLRGATALLKMRGVNQMHRADGRRLFLQITGSLLTSCIYHKTAFPDHVLELRAEAEQFADANSLTWRLHGAMIKLANLRAKVHNDVLSDPYDDISKALELDEIFLSIFRGAPTAWQYEKIYTAVDPHIIFAGCYHVYPSFIAAQSWNAMRSLRRFSHIIILEALNRGFSLTPPLFTSEYYSLQVKASTRILLELQSDVLSSIPQHIGYIPKQGTARDVQPHHFLWSEFKSVDQDPFRKSTSSSDFMLPDVRMYGGYALLWNVWSAGVGWVTTPDVRDWIIAILRRISSSMDVRQANVLADLLQNKATWSNPSLSKRST